MSEETHTMSLVERLVAIQSDVKKWDKAKDAPKEAGGYAYFGEAQVKAGLRALYSKHGVVAIPSFTEFDVTRLESEKTGRNGTYTAYEFQAEVAGTVEFFADVDGEVERLGPFSIAGVGMDTRDKAIYKAETAAVRHWLLNTFNISDGMDPEDDNGNGDAPAVKPKAEDKPKTDPTSASAQTQKVDPFGLLNKVDSDKLLFFLSNNDFREILSSDGATTIGQFLDGYLGKFDQWTPKVVAALEAKFRESGLKADELDKIK